MLPERSRRRCLYVKTYATINILVGGVQQSHFLEYLGQYIRPFVESDLLLAFIMLMWEAAILSAMIDNIPFTAAMAPIILGMEQQGLMYHRFGGL